MANPLDSNELVRQSQTRTFYQPGGPGSRSYFYGLDTLYHFIESANQPNDIGGINPIFVPHPTRPGRYKLVGRTVDAPELPTISMTFHESWGGIPRPLMTPGCEFNVIEVHSRCRDFSDMFNGWDGYAMIYSGFRFSGANDLGTRTAADSDDPLTISAEATGIDIYPVGALSFGEEASSAVVVEVIDIVYGTEVQCANCGTPNDGADFIYAVTRANVGSPAAPGQVIYSLDGGATWNNSSITGIGATNEVRYINIAGNYLFVGTNSTTLFYTALNELTGAPTTWNSVTQVSDFHDVYVQSPTAIWFVNNATVYKTTSIAIPATAVDTGGVALRRINGVNKTLVATGQSGEVRYSLNNGTTWITSSAPAASNTHAVACVDDNYWLVGCANGNVYQTKDRGLSWSALVFPNAGTGSINDIAIATREVIWIAQTISNVAYLATTIDGGATWTASNMGNSRMLNWPTFQGISKIAVPSTKTAVNANNLAIGGLATGGADGILITASATIL
jgi:photosystem II stability/assembly factor-like uncharacterized protein